ncbi:MAG: alkaline phosphatase PhoX [Actinomycetes bacterium]
MRDLAAESLSRRRMFKWSGTLGLIGVTAAVADACAEPPPPPLTTTSTTTTLPPTTTTTIPLAPDANGVLLPQGFTSRIVAQSGEQVPGTGFTYPWYPDGAGTFADPQVPGGWYLTVNHELWLGSVTSMRFAPDGTVVSAQTICSGTYGNCAGGVTPWGTWLSCEEFGEGRVWECDPSGANPAQLRSALGTFPHEAAGVAADGRVYMTEDKQGGAFYRFTPTTAGDLSAGLLEVATGPTPFGPLTWVEVPDPSAATTATRLQVPGTLGFDGGEGLDTSGTDVFFSTKGDRRIWRYGTTTGVLEQRYQCGSGPLTAVDNVWVDDASQCVFVAEDGGNMELVVIRPDNSTDAVVRFVGQDDSEVTGPTFSPDGSRLFVNSQRAPAGATAQHAGITYEITGPWDSLLGR